jgi:hypothetical protein
MTPPTAMVGMLLGEPDVLILFGAVGGVMMGAVFFSVVAGLSAFCSRKP